MVSSMTAYGRAQDHTDLGQVCWEIRTVNHRFLDIHIRIPDMFREMEMSWRNLIRGRLQRGKVECNLSFLPEKAAPNLRLNHSIVSQLSNCAEDLKQYEGVSSQLTAIDILKWPQVVAQEPFDVSALAPLLDSTLQKALDSLKDSRDREGSALKAILLDKLELVSVEHQKACKIAPLRLELVKEKLNNKLSELAEKVDNDRMEQEIVIYAQKLDVDEELDRLKTHIQEARTHLEGNKVSGKRLDFLMQEFNREANTLASKSAHAELTQIALTLKVLIEQMREQIQNVE
jgi:uncharacterized protein (TIGR00255 family)